MEQTNEQPIEQIQSSKNIWIIVIAIIVTALIVGGGVYAWQRSNLKNTKQNLEQKISMLQNQINQLQQQVDFTQNQKNNDNSQIITPPLVGPKSNWQVYSNTKFLYKCPQEWSIHSNKNYNGQVELSECSKIYSGKISFDDGVGVSFGFVPQNVADNYEWAGQKWSDILINDIKNEPNAQYYSNNNFIGWISMKNQKHTLRLIARHQVDGGYYEVSAEAAGDTKTDKEFKEIIDKIISTFEIN